jgi:hypothetical protein
MTTGLPGRRVSRRVVLRTGALAGAMGLVAGLPSESERPPRLTSGAGANLTAQMTRREDQLSLRFEFVNLTLLKAGQPGPGAPSLARLVRTASAQPAYIIVHFGPQALGEFAYQEDDDNPAIVKTPVPAAVAGGTRLAFLVPPSIVAVPYTISDLLAWDAFTPSVVPNAVIAAPGKPVPTEPGPTQTAVEAPWALVVSPHEQSVWAHAVDLADIPPDGRTELWHTRLAVRKAGVIDEHEPDGRTVRAVWTPWFNRTTPPPEDAYTTPPGTSSLDHLNKYELIRLTSDWDIVSRGEPYVPEALAVEQLSLSSLGAWLKASGDWPGVYDDELQRPFLLESLIHHATMGRDAYVRVVERGFALGTGNRSTWITVTQRKFGVVNDPTSPQHGKPVAYLSQTHHLVVRELERTYPAPDGPEPNPARQPFDGRDMPFKKLRILTQVTPPLLAPEVANPTTQISKGGGQTYGSEAFWPRVSTGPGTDTDFLFAVEGTDAEGRVVRFRMPLVFVKNTLSDKNGDVEKIIAAYEADEDRITCALHGQRVALAAFPGGAPGECAYELVDMTLGASLPDPPTGMLDIFRQPRFYPRMIKARARLEAVERVAGGAYGPQTLRPHQAWLTDPDHDARLFATLDDGVDVAFGADASGGVVTPNLRITGLSARTGPTGGDMAAGPPTTFDPAAFFAGAAPKLLGAISLLDIVEGAGFDAGAATPRLVTRAVSGGTETSLTWQPTVAAQDPDGIFVRGGSGAMAIVARTVVRDDGSTATTEISGDVTDFSVNAIGAADLHMVTIGFSRLRFASANGTKPDVHADVAGVTFHGILEFVAKLQAYLGSIGQSQGYQAQVEGSGSNTGGSIEVTEDGIKVGYTVGLPPIAVGVFSLENIAVGSSLAIPFDGQPARVRFSFAERDKPFLLTVSLFGGGGFVGVSFGLDQFELFEAALEFGAKLALDIGVASGGVSAVAGVYLAIGPDKGDLTGYLRLNGELEVLGLVHLAIEFYLGFTYDMVNKEVWGEASVTVEVDVLLFSGSVTLGPVRKRFAGGGGGGGGGGQASLAPAAARTGSGEGGRVRRLAKVGGPMQALSSSGTVSFDDLMLQPDWNAYCALYAPAAFA